MEMNLQVKTNYTESQSTFSYMAMTHSHCHTELIFYLKYQGFGSNNIKAMIPVLSVPQNNNDLVN